MSLNSRAYLYIGYRVTGPNQLHVSLVHIFDLEIWNPKKGFKQMMLKKAQCIRSAKIIKVDPSTWKRRQFLHSGVGLVHVCTYKSRCSKSRVRLTFLKLNDFLSSWFPPNNFPFFSRLEWFLNSRFFSRDNLCSFSCLPHSHIRTYYVCVRDMFLYLIL